METKKYVCLEDYINEEEVVCFKEGDIYTFSKNGHWYRTEMNNQGFSHKLDKSDINLYFKEYKTPEKIGHLETPKHYDNSKGTLYKVATERGWNPYLFDIVKRLERSEKKGEFKTDLEKSINVIKLWLQEYEEIKN